MKRLHQVFTFFITVAMLAMGGALLAQQPGISNMRQYDQDGVNVFEVPKSDTVPFNGLSVRIGGHFAQQFQSLDHENTPVDLDNDGVVDNALYALKPGFNLATANLNIDAQLYDGVRLNLITYLSSRHHSEAWVKGGYIQFDKLAFLNNPFFDDLMENLTIKVGHMEVNYGDQHFRRTDNGNAMYNPFVGNTIMDAFNTEIGAEIYYKGDNGIIGMIGVTGSEINGNVGEANTSESDDNANRAPSIIGKLAYDSPLNETVRLRVSGSVYYTASSAVNHLYTGDRGGSRYYLVTEAAGASSSSAFRSGRYSPGFTDKVTALMGNVFLKANGLEVFGTYENATGRNWFEPDTRNANQFAVDLVYRFGQSEDIYLAGRYNTVNAEDGSGVDVTINRVQVGAGWFLTPNVLLKGEYVNQEFNDFPNTSLLYEASFNGIVLEAVVGF